MKELETEKRGIRNFLKKIYINSSLATKIRYSYLLILIPMIFMMFFCVYNLWTSNHMYSEMLNSTSVASEFSLDFKKDFDYEAYLVIVESKDIEESELENMINEARRIVNGLETITDSKKNTERLTSIKKYLDNLYTYTERIKRNLKDGDKYETNMEIWENDIQIVTSLIRETIFQYIYYEINDIQYAHKEYQKTYGTIISFTIIAFACVIFLIILLSYYIPGSITNPIKKLSELTEYVSKGNLSVRSDIKSGAEVQMLSESFNSMIDKIEELLGQVKTEQIRLRKAEFELLQAQINPHFLYNTLGTIVWLAEAGEEKKVVSMVESLSEFFRTSLNQGKDIISIKEELQHVKSYLKIQQVRYQDILRYEIDVSPDLYKYTIPKITIQPLVENALYHGIKNKRGKGKITIKGVKSLDYFILQIYDDGIGMNENRLQQVCYGIKHKIPEESDIYGLYNVNERIVLNFGELYGISIDSKYREGTIVNIKLPYSEKEFC